jgi:hypothetical protein
VWRKLYDLVFFIHYCAGDKTENNQMGGTFSSDGGGVNRLRGFGGDT